MQRKTQKVTLSPPHSNKLRNTKKGETEKHTDPHTDMQT